MIKLTVRVDDKVHEKLRKIAFKGRVSINALINSLILEIINKK